MRLLMCGLTMSLGFLATDVTAEVTLNVDGTDYSVSTLMENCKNITGQPEAQIACFTALSQMLAEQPDAAEEGDGSVAIALDALRKVAQYQDSESGLSIAGSDCSIQIVYFANYFHISRRNISTIDLYSAQFDASQLQYDQTAGAQSMQAVLSKGYMDDGITAAMRGGAALESTEHNFSPKSARTTIDVYANEVASQLPARENQAFDFVLVHPERRQASADIWKAFETFVTACKG